MTNRYEKKVTTDKHGEEKKGRKNKEERKKRKIGVRDRESGVRFGMMNDELHLLRVSLRSSRLFAFVCDLRFGIWGFPASQAFQGQIAGVYPIFPGVDG